MATILRSSPPGHTVFDLGLARQIRRGVELNLSFDNLTNRDYYETQNYFDSRVTPDAPDRGPHPRHAGLSADGGGRADVPAAREVSGPSVRAQYPDVAAPKTTAAAVEPVQITVQGQSAQVPDAGVLRLRPDYDAIATRFTAKLTAGLCAANVLYVVSARVAGVTAKTGPRAEIYGCGVAAKLAVGFAVALVNVWLAGAKP